MSERSTGTTDSRKPASTLAELAKEHGSVKNIPAEALASLGFQVVTEVMRGRKVTKVVPVEQKGQPVAEADAKPKYPVTELSPKTKADLGVLTGLQGKYKYGLHLERETTEPKGERKVTLGQRVSSRPDFMVGDTFVQTPLINGNTFVTITDTSYPRRHYENTITRELEFAADGSTVFAASITVDKPQQGEYGGIERDPKVTEIAPAGLEGFAADILETVQQELALDARQG